MTSNTITQKKRIGPGEYRPDPTEALLRKEDLPQPKILHESRSYAHQPCPHCGRAAYRDRVFRRQLHEVGDLRSGQPQELEVEYSQHYCRACGKYFSVDLSDLAPPGGHYTHRVMALAVRSVVEDGLAYRPASWRLWRDQRVFVPFATIQNWVEAGGEKGG